MADAPGAKRTYALAAAWGIAEATLFFIVPDVLLSRIAIRRYKRAMICCAWATAGALLGGFALWWLGAVDPEPARVILAGIPAISEQMIANVREQLDSRGIVALFVGPLIGTPYKIYALEAAGADFGLLLFLAVSVPARMMRFVIVTTVAAAGSYIFGKFVSTRVILIMHIVVWTIFYAWYFHAMGVY